jgi:predicted MFS family arabinose efflux permease
VWMGLTYMATLPPTSGLVGKLFGTRRLGTLLGVVMLVHQVGAFLGVWLGGVAVESTGGYAWVWHADVALCLVAAALHLPLREPRPTSRANPMPALRAQPVGRGS